MPSIGAGPPAGGSPASRQQSEGDAQGKRDGNHLQKAIEDIRAYLAIIGLPGKLKDAWERVERGGEAQVEALRSAGDERQSGATAQEIANIIDKRLEAGLQRLENKVDDKLETIQKAVQAPAKLLYADVAKSLRDAGIQPAKPPPTEVRAPGRYQREVVVAAGTETEEQKRRNGKELVEELNKHCAGKVLAARRLGSGDVLVTTTDRATRQEMQKDIE